MKRGREAYRRRAWEEAHRSLSLADRATALGPPDLDRLAVSAYLIGRDEEYLQALERAHHAWLEAGDALRAVRSAFWLGLRLLFRGEGGPATGWLGRAHRLLDGLGQSCVEQGYLLLPVAERQLRNGDPGTAHTTGANAVSIGERFADADLVACARHVQGRALLLQGQVEKGLALLDEAMVAVTSGELSPIVTGLVYCSVIAACQQVYALGRAREWTSALARWCEGQPDMVAFTGTCLVHRAEILQRSGAWSDAIEEAQRACERFSRGFDRQPPAAAFYQQAEVHRLRGDFDAAEEAFRLANERGGEPLPGLALLRLAQGRADAAAASMRRVVGATADPLERSRLLPAHVEVLLAVGDIEGARVASAELESIAGKLDAGARGALAAQARGAVELAAGDATAALASLRRAWREWQGLEAPYEAACVRVLVGLACRALRDEDGCRLELDAARAAFADLGASPDLARIDSLIENVPPAPSHGLTPRELEVLRLVATGKTNKAIARELFVSEKTVDRHVSNIFNKLDVSSRAAATAWAYEHQLI